MMQHRPLIILTVCLALPTLACAAERTARLAGSRLTIDSPCAREIDVQPDSGLHDQVMVIASAAHPEELDHLALDAGEPIRVHALSGSCWRPDLFGQWRPTLRLTVQVPVGLAMTIEEGSAASYVLGAIGGRLALDISGAADVSAQDADAIDVSLSGVGHIAIAAAKGAAKVSLSGGGDVILGMLTSPVLAAEISGAGSLAVDAGRIGRATVEESGVGTVQIGATVDEAHVDLSGMGSVHFTRVTGQVEKQISGLGSVTVGR